MAKAKTPAPKVGGPSQDLISRGMLPDVPTIKPGAGFGDDVKSKKPGGRYGGGHIKKMAEGGMTDEEKYGKVGAEIRRLDPEAYKNRKDRSAAANMKLLRELREKSKEPSSRSMSTDEFMQGTKKRGFDVSSPSSDSPSRKMSTKEFMEGTKKRGFNVSSPKAADSDTPARTISAKEFMEGTKKRGFNVSAPRAADSDTPARRMSVDDFIKGMKKGGAVKSSASKRADGCAVRGKTKGRMV